MENDPKNEVENAPKEEPSRLTRRTLLQVTAVGALVAATGLHVVFRKPKSKQTLAPTDISIEGPFEKYGSFKPEDLGLKPTSKIGPDLQLLQIGFSQGTYEDRIAISFTFTGKEDPNRMTKVSVSIYDKEKKIIGGAEHTFRDSRINARNVKSSNMEVFEPISAFSVSLNNTKKMSHVSRIEIVTMEVGTL